MEPDYPLVVAKATPEYVLAVLADMHRQQCRFDPEADPTASLSFESTVKDWREACDLVGWRGLGRALNQVWEVDCSEAEWQGVREPPRERRLLGVCELLAERARRPLLHAATLGGRSCRRAGAFLTIRSLLHHAGASISGLAPSTPLSSYTRNYPGVFLDPISRLAPGALPLVRIRTPVYHAALLSFLVGLLLLAVGASRRWGVVLAIGALSSVIAYALTWLAARHVRPAAVDFGDLHTFRDLAIALAEAEPNNASQLTAGNRASVLNSDDREVAGRS